MGPAPQPTERLSSSWPGSLMNIADPGICGSPPSLTLPRKGGGNGEDKPGHDEIECYDEFA